MISFFDKYIRVRLWLIVLFVFIIGTVVLLVFYFRLKDDRMVALLGGIAAGMLVAIVQLLLDVNEHREIERSRLLGIYEILPHREGKSYYERLISDSSREICLLGNTANRFIEDFAHSDRDDSQALIRALLRHVNVKILIPNSTSLGKADRARAQAVQPRLMELQKNHTKFEVRYFNHPPAHNIVLVDNECLVGPIFPNVQSKDSPAIHCNAASPFVASYLKHFNDEWNEASKDNN